MVRSGTKCGEIGALGAYQQLANEKGMPGKLGEDARFDAIFRISAAVEVLRVQRLAPCVRDEVFIKPLEVLRRDLAVAAPPHRVFGERIDDGMLVLGRSAGMGAGFRAQRPAVNDRGFVPDDGALVEERRGVIPVHRREVLEAKSVGAVGAVPQTRFLHERPPRRSRLPPNLLPLHM